jgi:hypothetical protein
MLYMTDGVGQPLADIPEVQEALARRWATRPTVFEFASQVSFARKTHMDDRTVVGIWPTVSAPVAADDDRGDGAS